MFALRLFDGIKEAMQMHDEVADLRVVDGLLRLRPPRRVSFGVIRIETDDVDLAEIFEFDVSDPGKFSAEYEVQQLLRVSFGAHLCFPDRRLHRRINATSHVDSATKRSESGGA